MTTDRRTDGRDNTLLPRGTVWMVFRFGSLRRGELGVVGRLGLVMQRLGSGRSFVFLIHGSRLHFDVRKCAVVGWWGGCLAGRTANSFMPSHCLFEPPNAFLPSSLFLAFPPLQQPGNCFGWPTPTNPKHDVQEKQKQKNTKKVQKVESTSPSRRSTPNPQRS